MCKSQAEGGQRCAGHTRVPFERAHVAFEKAVKDPKATPQKVAKARERVENSTMKYASTDEGREMVLDMIADAEREGRYDGDLGSAHLRQMLRRGRDLADANAEAAAQIRAAKAAQASAAEPDTSYRMTHTAPSPDFGASMDDLNDFFPGIYDRKMQLRLYGHMGDKVMDMESLDVINRAHEDPDAVVVMYRAVPRGVKNIHSGDWVTTSRRYAQQHLESNLDGRGAILAVKVPAREMWNNGDSIHEWGWVPQTAAKA